MSRAWYFRYQVAFRNVAINRSMAFNAVNLGQLYPRNRYELKLGINSDLGHDWMLWANLSGDWGSQNYEQYTAWFGAKHTWLACRMGSNWLARFRSRTNITSSKESISPERAVVLLSGFT